MIQRPKGTNDIYGREAKIWKCVEAVIDQVMEKYNYNYIRTPIFESSELKTKCMGMTINQLKFIIMEPCIVMKDHNLEEIEN